MALPPGVDIGLQFVIVVFHLLTYLLPKFRLCYFLTIFANSFGPISGQIVGPNLFDTLILCNDSGVLETSVCSTANIPGSCFLSGQ